MKKVTLMLLTFCFPIALVSPLVAKERAPQAQKLTEERIQKRQEIKSDKTEDRCVAMQKRIQDRIAKHDSHYGEYALNYQGLKTAATKRITALEKKGIDVSVLKSHLIELDALVKQFSTDKATYMQKLRETTKLSCGKSDGALKESTQAVLEAHKKVLSDARKIREYYLLTIKPAIKELQK